ncbi:uncharacterized protein LOC143459671 [Clavelina lepadiformis]|uniref:uncharacterized protein LOC143459671 n=1 Tax=Clavelina lepadiformis TaxID=159417 RepID=UPI004042711A
MYKLTYESDEDVTAPGDDARSRTSDHHRIEEKSDLGNPSSQAELRSQWSSYPEHKDKMEETLEQKERSSTAASTTMAAFGVKREKSTEANSKQTDQKRTFYSLFKNDPVDDKLGQRNTPSTNQCEFWKVFFVVFFMMGLTAGVVILFVLYQDLNMRNDSLMSRINYLETHGPRATGQVAVDALSAEVAPPLPEHVVPPSPRHFDSFQNPPSAELSIDDTLSSLRSELDQFKLRVSANQNEIGELQEENNDRSKEYQAVVGKIRARLLLLSDRLSSSVDAQRVFENMLRELQADIAVMNYTVSSSLQDVFQYFDYGTEVSEDDYEAIAFDAVHIRTETNIDTHGMGSPDFFEVMYFPDSSEADSRIFYNYEMINRLGVFEAETGTFNVPSDGIYVFFVTFCTNVDSTDETVISLMQNLLPIRRFRVPFSSFGYTDTEELSDLEELMEDYMEPNVMQHKYTVITELMDGDEIYLRLTKGSIFEKSNTAELQDEACTRFSGFKLR